MRVFEGRASEGVVFAKNPPSGERSPGKPIFAKNGFPGK
jgi:hypothetical protein